MKEGKQARVSVLHTACMSHAELDIFQSKSRFDDVHACLILFTISLIVLKLTLTVSVASSSHGCPLNFMQHRK